METDSTLPTLELCMGTLLGTPLQDMIEAAAGAGFKAITVNPAMYWAARDAGLSEVELRHRLDDAGLAVNMLDGLTISSAGAAPVEDLSQWIAAMYAATDGAFRIADALGATAFNVAQVLFNAFPFPLVVEAIEEIASRTSEHGIRVALEFTAYSATMPTVDSALEIINASTADNIRITFDTWHFFRSGGEPSELAQLPPAVVECIQVADAPIEAKGVPPQPLQDRLLPGEGAIPIREIVSGVLATNPGLNVGIEVFSSSLRAMSPAVAAQKAFDSLRAALESGAESR